MLYRSRTKGIQEVKPAKGKVKFGIISIFGVCLCLLLTGVAAGETVIIDNNDFIALSGNEEGSGLGTLDLVLFAGATANNKGGDFNGDDACTDMPSGGGATSATESYITSVGELRDFYRLNFPDGNSPTGSTVSEMVLFIDLNTDNTVDVNLNTLQVVVDYDLYGGGDPRDDPYSNDISSAVQNSTDANFSYTPGVGSLEAEFTGPKTLPVLQQGSGWADYGIVLGIDPFDSRFQDSTRILFHWASTNHTTGGEEIFLSGRYAEGDVVDINDHVWSIEIAQGWDYEYPDDPCDLTYEFTLRVATDTTIDFIEFLTPAGYTFQIPQLGEQCVDEVCTSYVSDGNTAQWEYYGGFSDQASLADYSDGLYTVKVYYASGGQGQTTVSFTVPGTSDPIPQPIQEPILTYPTHNSTVPPLVTFNWEDCDDAAVNMIILVLENLETSDGLYSDFPPDANSWDNVDLSEASWEGDLSFGARYTPFFNDDGVEIKVSKYSESDHRFILADIANHVFKIEIDNCWDYEDPNDANDTFYEFHFLVETDDTINLIKFQSPEGNTFEIPMVADQWDTNEIHTHWEIGEETGGYEWEYDTHFSDVNGLEPYGDGIYTITVYYKLGGQSQTIVRFGIPGTTDPIPQPTQEPTITFPQLYGYVLSPVTITWEPCIDPAVNMLWMSVEELSFGEGYISNVFDVNETSWGPVELADGYWEVDFDFRRWYEIPDNGDGIQVEVGKYSEGDYEFIVSELFWPLRVAQQYEYNVSDNLNNNWTELLVIDSQADINSVNYFHILDDGYIRLTLTELYEYNSEGDDFLQHQKAPVGTKWSFYREHESGFNYKVIEIVSIGPVTVPLEHFNTSYKFRRFRCVDPNDLGQGKSPDWYEWIVPGVGWVKQEDYWVEVGEEAPLIKELVHIYHPDFNNDGNVNFQDFSTIAISWQAEEGDGNYNQECDLSYVKDKVIDVSDLAVFVEYWLLGI